MKLEIPSKIASQIEKPKPFGGYLLLNKFAEGGMAKIYHAIHSASNDAIESKEIKLVVIKILQHDNIKHSGVDLRRIFLDEVRVAKAMNHPNIVKTLDHGEIKNTPYVVMEFINGYGLDFFMRHLHKENAHFPIPVAVEMIIQAADGLHFAHQSIDPVSGLKNEVVHRDISPQNIMVEFNGRVKIIDFGVVKAKSNEEKTRTGFLKGKLSYFAPEALTEEVPVDHRYDQFSLTAVLWELLIGKKLFAGNDALEITRRIYECRIPDPRDLNPDIPEELARIILKALSKNRDDRYASMSEYALALRIFFKKCPHVDLSNYLQTHFLGHYQRQTSEIVELKNLAFKTLTPFSIEKQNKKVSKVQNQREIAVTSESNHYLFKAIFVLALVVTILAIFTFAK